MIEARYVIQNRIPNYLSYRNIISMITQSHNIILKGFTLWIPRSFFLAITNFNYTNSGTLLGYFASQNLLYTLAYPFLTVQRRLEVSDTTRPGMVPTRYLGPIHAFGLISREEGYRAFYKGLVPYLVATSLTISLIPIIGEYKMMQSPLYGNFYDE